MLEVRVFDLFGPICVDSDDGIKLCGEAHAALDCGESVRLDFSGVTTLASAFLNAAVGCLYAYFPKEDLDQRLQCTGLDSTDDAVVRFVRRNAVRFYSANRPQQEALLSSSTRAAGE